MVLMLPYLCSELDQILTAPSPALLLCRLIPMADIRKKMKSGKIAAALDKDGALENYTVLLWLNGLAVSDIKETLKEGDDEKNTQEAW